MVIVFDLGKVILDFNLTKISSKLSAISGFSESDIAFFLFENDFSRTFDRGCLTNDEFYATVRDRFKLTITYGQFKHIWNEIFTPVPGMETLINSLKAKHRVGLLSNTNRLHFEYIAETYPVVRGMDWHLSYEMHLMKPEPEIYRKVADFYKAKPSDVFFTDDLAVNIEGAKAVGIQAVQFHSVENLRCELAARGISI